jgi:hypothetical protein
MWIRSVLALLLTLATLAPATAGPPYLTDDPVPTETGHWEIYAFGAGEGRSAVFDGDLGVDLNYGPARNVQLTATLPLTVAHDGEEWRSGRGDVELGVKYRFLRDEESGFSAAIFPRIILPTSSLDSGGRTRILLPLWVQKDFGSTSLFGGGGFEINPGTGNRNFWQYGVAVTRQVHDIVSVGAEVTRQTRDTTTGTAQTRAGVGTTVKLSSPFALLISGGPTWSDHHRGYHVYSAIGLNF